MIYNLSKSLVHEGAIVTCLHSGKNPLQNKTIFNDSDLVGLNFITLDLFSYLRNKNIFLRFIFETMLSIFLSIKIFFLYKKIKNINLIIWYGPSAFLWFPAVVMKLISKAPILHIKRYIPRVVTINRSFEKINTVSFKIFNISTIYIPDKIGIESQKIYH